MAGIGSLLRADGMAQLEFVTRSRGRLRFGTSIARPSATRAASLMASDRVGCGAMPSATVSTAAPGVDRDDAGLDHVGHVRADHHQAEQSAAAGRVDRLHPAGRLVLHHGTGVRDPRERPRRDVVAILSARLGFGQADAGDLRVGVDRARHGAVADRGVVPACVLRRHLPFTEGGVGELPVAGAVADGVDVRDASAPPRVGGDARSPVKLDAGSFQAEPLTSGPRPVETSIRSAPTLWPSPKWTVSSRSGVFDVGAVLAELHRDAALAELLGELAARRPRPLAGSGTGASR